MWAEDPPCNIGTDIETEVDDHDYTRNMELSGLKAKLQSCFLEWKGEPVVGARCASSENYPRYVW